MTREKAKKILRSWDGVYIGYSSDEVEEAHNMAIQALSQEPTEKPMTVDEMEREYEKSKALFHKIVSGKWIGIDEEPHEDYECSYCGYVVSTFTANIEPHTEYKYCPNCGCRMVEPQESEG